MNNKEYYFAYCNGCEDNENDYCWCHALPIEQIEEEDFLKVCVPKENKENNNVDTI